MALDFVYARACRNLPSRCQVVFATGLRPACGVGVELIGQELSVTVPTLFQSSLSLPFHHHM